MPKYHSPALDKGLDILEYLANHGYPQSQTEIALGINRKPNEIYRMLVCLEERGFIKKDGISGKFDLSLRLYHLSRLHSPINAIRRAAIYPLRELSEYTKQSCHLSILHKNDVLIVTQVLSSGPVSLSIEDGTIIPLYQSTSGRIILSQLDNVRQLQYLNKNKAFNKLPKKQMESYLSQLEKVRRKGHEISQSKSTYGVIDIAVPFGAPEIDIVGSLVVTILSGDIQKSVPDEKIVKQMYSTVKNIYKNMGITPKNE